MRDSDNKSQSEHFTNDKDAADVNSISDVHAERRKGLLRLQTQAIEGKNENLKSFYYRFYR